MTQRLAVFASGGGSNLQALIDRFQEHADAPARVALVVSDRPTAGALTRARAAGIPVHIIDAASRADDATDETLDLLRREAIDLVALAGYVRLVPSAIVDRYRRRIVNIHPALLPAFGGKGMYGLRVHRAVLETGCLVTGATVHYVDERYDEGRIIAQWPVPVLDGDSPETLAARVLRVEHLLYPLAIERIGRAAAHGADVELAGLTNARAFFAAPNDEPDEAVMRRTFGLD